MGCARALTKLRTSSDRIDGFLLYQGRQLNNYFPLFLFFLAPPQKYKTTAAIASSTTMIPNATGCPCTLMNLMISLPYRAAR